MCIRDSVITLCQEEVCPMFLAKKVIHHHWPTPDPAGIVGEDEDQIEGFRKVRDQILIFLITWLTLLEQKYNRKEKSL